MRIVTVTRYEPEPGDRVRIPAGRYLGGILPADAVGVVVTVPPDDDYVATRCEVAVGGLRLSLRPAEFDLVGAHR
jgi:hypothetical protein